MCSGPDNVICFAPGPLSGTCLGMTSRVHVSTLSPYSGILGDAIGRCKGAVNAWGCALPLVWKHPLWEGLARLLNAATGLDFSPDGIQAAANRIYLPKRCFAATG